MASTPALPTREPWGQLENETGKAYAAFLAYRNLGLRRSLARAEQVCYNKEKRVKSASLHMKTWSVKFNWVDRCKAWDEHLQRVATEEAEIQIRKRVQELTAVELKRSDRLKGILDEFVKDFRKRQKAVKVELLARASKEGNDNLNLSVVMDSTSLKDLIKAEQDYQSMVRRALGLPEKITKEEHSGKVDASINITDVRDRILDELMGSLPEKQILLIRSILEAQEEQRDGEE